MAKLIYSAIASLDGYVEDEQGKFDRAAPDAEVLAFVNELERPIGAWTRRGSERPPGSFTVTAAPGDGTPPGSVNCAERVRWHRTPPGLAILAFVVVMTARTWWGRETLAAHPAGP